MPRNLKIATHNSATGERPLNLLSYLMIPFCRTQSKTLKEQYEAGCRMFDLRIKEHKGKWHLAHGLFLTKKTFTEVLSELESFGEPCYILVTYEGKLATEEAKQSFIAYIKDLQKDSSNLMWGPVCVKYTNDDLIVDWETIIPSACDFPENYSSFLQLTGENWQTFIPIPWLWKQFYFKNVTFNDEYYKFVDFL